MQTCINTLLDILRTRRVCSKNTPGNRERESREIVCVCVFVCYVREEALKLYFAQPAINHLIAVFMTCDPQLSQEQTGDTTLAQ